MKDGSKLVFPQIIADNDEPGMTLRQWYAGMALQGWIANLRDAADDYDDEPEAFAQHQRAVAKACYGYADAMIEEEKER